MAVSTNGGVLTRGLGSFKGVWGSRRQFLQRILMRAILGPVIVGNSYILQVQVPWKTMSGLHST